MKKNLIILALGLVAVMPAKAQWTQYNTDKTVSGVLNVLNKSINYSPLKTLRLWLH